MSGLFCLPRELMLIVLYNIPDSETLYALICTCSEIEKLFREDSSCILEEIISSLPWEIQQFSCWITILSSLKSPNSPYYIQSESYSAVELFVKRFRELHPSIQPFIVPELLPALSNTVGPRHTLIVACRIKKLENICLARMMEHAHNSMTWCLEDNSYSDYPFSPRSKRKYPRPCARWSPTWIERFRVNRALWQMYVSWYTRIRLELPNDGELRENRRTWYRTLNTHLARDVGLLSCPWIWEFLPTDEFDSVYRTLGDILGRSPTQTFTLMIQGQRQTTLNEEICVKFAPYVEQAKHWEKLDPQPNNTEAGDILGQSQRHKDTLNYGTFFFFMEFLRSSTWLRADELKYESFSLLGLPIWDTKRLAYLCLARLPRTLIEDNQPPPIDFDKSQSDLQHCIWHKLIMQNVVPLTLDSHSGNFDEENLLNRIWGPSERPYCNACGVSSHYSTNCLFRGIDEVTGRPIIVGSPGYYHNMFVNGYWAKMSYEWKKYTIYLNAAYHIRELEFWRIEQAQHKAKLSAYENNLGFLVLGYVENKKNAKREDEDGNEMISW